MFKLRFFILFLLAGSYFGTGEGLAPLKGEGETSSSGTGASNSEKKDENTDVSETNGEKEAEGSSSKEKEGAGNKESAKEDVETTIQKENHTLGYELPEYIGSLKERGKYIMKLLSACGQSQEYSVNEREIFFHNCTYICVKRDANLTPEARRIPPGMICNKDKGVLGPVKVKIIHLEQKEQPRTLGRDLPGYIGSLDQRKEYMIKLFGACGGQSQVYKVNEKQIFFHNCTYVCVQRNRDLTSGVHRIPVGMICNRDKGTCPKEGDCPLPTC
uniref:Putative ticsk ixostatin n=1 Tax=Ixodes ricinus TaxID=34613 RepID=A0A147BFK1_IXORI